MDDRLVTMPAFVLKQPLLDIRAWVKNCTCVDLWGLYSAHEAERQMSNRPDVLRVIERRIATLERLKKLYDVIIEFKTAHDGCSPNQRELVALTSYGSTSTVSYALDRLEEQGLIRLSDTGQARRIEVVGARWEPPDNPDEILRAHTLREELKERVESLWSRI